ncbi:MAG: ParB/RepB/Spo0J family partition protein [Dehalococcoidia bacterium]|nr:ParB/RepB/Spo0J family partition protein [Dehalococcoidia bacterium]MYA54224.1 ParB/RepB/Spo0J family partition protein [Dehalococcoidia bacterium]
MTQPRRGLGRGLDALLPGGAEEATPPGRTLQEIDIDLIAPNPEQPRTNFPPEQLRELAESIREHGVLQPLVVSLEEEGGYRLIAGERRLQAARLADLPTVPVVVREVDGSELLELALVENIQRADLNPIEEALAYRRLLSEYGLTQEEVAKRVGRSRAAVANATRLLQLESEIRRSLVAGEIREGHARALLGMPEGPGRLEVWREAVRRGLSVRETEAAVRRALSPRAARPPTAPSSSPPGTPMRDLETNLRRALGTRVTVSAHRAGGARIVVDTYSDEELEAVTNRLLSL